ncbi:2OG-Fe dioxygenase family protein [Pendulispora albinea]|uniref:2OG-Fe dioxygenase family protein n=1 Tax=Pendulispora albinea TaxID=2741071 RepID=A0ABZ2M8Z3_9BACT
MNVDNPAPGAIVKPREVPVPLDLSDFLYEAIDATSFLDMSDWATFYDEIPVDPYIQEGYRYKAIGWFRIKHAMAAAIEGIDAHIAEVNRLSGMNDEESSQYLSSSRPDWQDEATGYCCWQLPQYAMQQSIKYNPVHGDMRREYPRINEHITRSRDFHRLLLHYAAYFGWSDAIVLVQFQRVDCYSDRKGLPAVEGFHQDGNPHVGMLIVNRDNIADDSGVSQYMMDDNGKRTDILIFDTTIPAGQLIYWNDKRLWHYGTEIRTANENVNGGRGVRDIIILSAKTPPANMPIGPIPAVFR